MANLNSTQYANIYVNKYVTNAGLLRGRIFALQFNHTVGSDANGDTVNLAVIPAGTYVVGIDVANSALGASTTLSIGDAGSATRYLAATSVTSAGKNSGLLAAGQNYNVTSDTIVLGTWGGANPTAAGTISGVIWCVASV